MKKLLLLLAVVLNLTVAHGQAQITFQKTFGGTDYEFGNSVFQTTEGGYIIAGMTNSFGVPGNADMYFIKTNGNGDTLWTKTFGGTHFDNGISLQQTIDGGYVIAGISYSFDVLGNDNEDAYLIKTDTIGNILWSKTYGGTTHDWATSIHQTFDSGYIFTGRTESFFSGYGTGVYLVKTDDSGNTLWSKSFGYSNYNNVGNSVRQTTDGGYLIGGNTRSVSGGYDDFYVTKTDALGNISWSKTYGGANNDDLNSILQTIDGSYILCGETESFGSGGLDIYLIKIDINGNILWSKTYGSTGYEGGGFVQETTDGGFIITGSTNSFGFGSTDVYLVKTNSIGNIFWSRTFGGTDYDEGRSIQQTTDGAYIVAGYTTSFGVGSSGVSDIYLIKTDSNGNGGCNETTPNSIVTSPSTITSNGNNQVASGVIVGNPTPQLGSGGVVTTLCSTVGINELNPATSISVYPNPFSTQTVLQTDNLLHNATLTVYNYFGQAVKQIKNISGQSVTLSRDNLPSGLYFFRLTEDKKIFTDKLVITDN